MFRLFCIIDVKRNFEQTNPFECFFTLLYISWKSIYFILPPKFKFQSLYIRKLFLNMIYYPF